MIADVNALDQFGFPFSKPADCLLHEQNLYLTQVIPRNHTRQKLVKSLILNGFSPLCPNLLLKN